MTETIINFFRELFNNDILTILFVSLLPIVELKGAIPAAYALEMAWYEALGFAFLGSMIVVPILLLILKPILEWMKKIKIFKSLAIAVEDMFSSKAKKISQKVGTGDSAKREEWIKCLGVFIFVALPLPLTGVWTGTAIAVFLGVKFWHAFGTIFLGNLTAGSIVTVICHFAGDAVDTILNCFLIIVIILLLLFIVKLVIRMVKNKKKEKDNINLDATNNNDANGGSLESNIDSTVDENDTNKED